MISGMNHGCLLRRVCRLAVGLCLLGAGGDAPAQTIVWTGGGAPSVWADPNNWSPARLPAAADDVLIPAGASSVNLTTATTRVINSIVSQRQLRISNGTLTVTGAASLPSLVLSGGVATFDGPATVTGVVTMSGGTLGGAGAISVNGGLTWTLGELTGTGVLNLGGTSTFTGQSSVSYELLLSRSLTVNGTLNLSSCAINLGGGRTFTIAPSGTVNFGNETVVGASIFSVASGAEVVHEGVINHTVNRLDSIGVRMGTGPNARINVTAGGMTILLSGDQFGDVAVSAGAVVSLNGDPSANFQPGAVLSGPGRSLVSGVAFALGSFQTTGGLTVQGGGATILDPVTDQDVGVTGGTFTIAGNHRWRTLSASSTSTTIISIGGNLTITERAWLSGGSFVGAGTMVFGPACLTTYETNARPSFGITTDNFGRLEPRNAGMILANNAVFTNRPGGVVDFWVPTLGLDSTGTFVNEGLVSSNINGTRDLAQFVNTDAGVVEMSGPASVRLRVAGTPPRGVISSAGIVGFYTSLGGSATIGDGLTVSAGQRLELGSGTFTISPAITLTTPQITAASGGTFRVDRDFGPASLAAGPLGTLEFTTALTVANLAIEGNSTTSGTLAGAGDVTVVASALLNGNLTGTGRLILAPTCTSSSNVSRTRAWSRAVENRGTMTLAQGGINMALVTFTNAVGGSVAVDTSANRMFSFQGAAPAIFRNLGTLTTTATSGTGALNVNVNVDQQGLASCDGGSLNFNSPVTQVAGDALNGGRWRIAGAGTLRLPAGTLIRAIDAPAHVMLSGTTAQLPALASNLRSVSGTLEIAGGRTQVLSNVAGGYRFENAGRIILGAGSDLSVLGDYNQLPSGRLQVDYNSPPLSGRLRSFTAALGGAAVVNFVNGFSIAPTTPLPFVAGSNGVTGRFASATLPVLRGISYTPTAATLTFRCPADVDDGSGTGTPDDAVTIDDLLYYLTIYDAGAVAADVDDGSGSGVRDGGVTIDDLLYLLVRYDGGC